MTDTAINENATDENSSEQVEGTTPTPAPAEEGATTAPVEEGTTSAPTEGEGTAPAPVKEEETTPDTPPPTTPVINRKPKTYKNVEFVNVIQYNGMIGMLRDETIIGFRQFIEAQSELDGKMRVSVGVYDIALKPKLESVPLSKTPALQKNWFGSGTDTFLYEAIAESIALTEQRIKKMKKDRRPDKVIVSIMTDGVHVGKFKDIVHEGISEIIAQKQKQGWYFIMLTGYFANHYTSIGCDQTLGFQVTGSGIIMAFGMQDLAVKLIRG